MTGTTNRLFINDVPVAVNSAIDLVPGVVKTIWTQPYLSVGTNTLRIVLNADGKTPTTGWLRIMVVAQTATPVPPAAPPAPPVPTPTTAPNPAPKPPTPPTPPPAPTTAPTPAPQPSSPTGPFKLGSLEWTLLTLDLKYTTDGVTLLKGKNYSRYNELVKLNADLTAALKTASVNLVTYQTLSQAWESFATDSAFKAAMTTASGTAKP